MAKTVKTLPVDDQLTEHLKEAEKHLLGALKQFDNHKLTRRVGYLARLVRAQELVTTLYREELVRIRSPHRPGRRK